jgi:hypothetical protein
MIKPPLTEQSVERSTEQTTEQTVERSTEQTVERSEKKDYTLMGAGMILALCLSAMFFVVQRHQSNAILETQKQKLIHEKSNEDKKNIEDKFNQALEAEKTQKLLASWQSKARWHYGNDPVDGIQLRSNESIHEDIKISYAKIDSARQAYENSVVAIHGPFGTSVGYNQGLSNAYNQVLNAEGQNIERYKMELKRNSYIYDDGANFKGF